MIGDAKMQVWCDKCHEEEWRDMTALARSGSYDDRNVVKDLRRDGWFVNDDETEVLCPECWRRDVP